MYACARVHACAHANQAPQLCVSLQTEGELGFSAALIVLGGGALHDVGAAGCTCECRPVTQRGLINLLLCGDDAIKGRLHANSGEHVGTSRPGGLSLRRVVCVSTRWLYCCHLKQVNGVWSVFAVDEESIAKSSTTVMKLLVTELCN